MAVNLAGGVDGQRGFERGEDEAGGSGHARALPLPEAAQAEDGASECGREEELNQLKL